MLSSNVVSLPSVQALPSPQAMLDDALKRVRRKNGLQRIANQWAGALRVAEAMAGFLTDRMPDTNGDPLILRCLRDSIDLYQRLTRDNPGRALDPEVFAAFLTAMIAPCSEVLCYQVTCPRSGAQWDPLVSDLHEFLTAHPLARIQPARPLSSDMLARLFAALGPRLVREKDLTTTQRTMDAFVEELVEANRCFYPCL